MSHALGDAVAPLRLGAVSANVFTDPEIATVGISAEDAMLIACTRARLMGEGESMLQGDDIRLMALVEYRAEDITDVLTDYPDLARPDAFTQQGLGWVP